MYVTGYEESNLADIWATVIAKGKKIIGFFQRQEI